jgi:y4mF family transcriptional regulator
VIAVMASSGAIEVETHVGEIVRFHRRRAGLTRVELARLAGVGKTVVFDIEKGKETVRLKTLLSVLGALNIRLDWSSPLRQAFEKASER